MTLLTINSMKEYTYHMSTEPKNAWKWLDESHYSSVSARLSLKAPPFPRAPLPSQVPPELVVTVKANKELFRIVSPFNASRFE